VCALVTAVGAAPGELSAAATDELDELRKHVEHREKSLS